VKSGLSSPHHSENKLQQQKKSLLIYRLSGAARLPTATTANTLRLLLEYEIGSMKYDC